jgi:hypothetical protein
MHQAKGINQWLLSSGVVVLKNTILVVDSHTSGARQHQQWHTNRQQSQLLLVTTALLST